jgi:hypothetical protein
MNKFKIYFKSFLSVAKYAGIAILAVGGAIGLIKLLILSISTVPFATIVGIVLIGVIICSLQEYKERKIEIEHLMFKADDLIWQISSYEQALSRLSANPEKNAEDIEYYNRSLKEDTDELNYIKNKIRKLGGEI